MGSMAREEGVLKLVHPGGFVEIHHEPVIASRVMAKNPRHFVTRPDVFKFPWIVVRPESVLKPGNVFFIVPCHTVYRLLRSSNSRPSNTRVSSASTAPTTRAPHQGPLRPIGIWAEANSVMFDERNCSVDTRQGDDFGSRFFIAGRPAQRKSCLKKDEHGTSSTGGRRVAFYLPDG